MDTALQATHAVSIDIISIVQAVYKANTYKIRMSMGLINSTMFAGGNTHSSELAQNTTDVYR